MVENEYILVSMCSLVTCFTRGDTVARSLLLRSVVPGGAGARLAGRADFAWTSAVPRGVTGDGDGAGESGLTRDERRIIVLKIGDSSPASSTRYMNVNITDC